jgi:hypothetical protein
MRPLLLQLPLNDRGAYRTQISPGRGNVWTSALHQNLEFHIKADGKNMTEMKIWEETREVVIPQVTVHKELYTRRHVKIVTRERATSVAPIRINVLKGSVLEFMVRAGPKFKIWEAKGGTICMASIPH